jgi:hypothetical protein
MGGPMMDPWSGGMTPGQAPGSGSGAGQTPSGAPSSGGWQDPWASGTRPGRAPGGFGAGPGFGAPPMGMTGFGQQPGMMGAPGMGWPGMGGGYDVLSPVRAMNLTKEQREQLNAISDGLNDKKTELTAEMTKGKEKLQSLADEQRAQWQALSELQRQMMEADQTARSQAEALLNDQQRQQLQQGQMPGRMMSPGMMMPPAMTAPGRGAGGYRGGGSSMGMGG